MRAARTRAEGRRPHAVASGITPVFRVTRATIRRHPRARGDPGASSRCRMASLRPAACRGHGHNPGIPRHLHHDPSSSPRTRGPRRVQPVPHGQSASGRVAAVRKRQRPLTAAGHSRVMMDQHHPPLRRLAAQARRPLAETQRSGFGGLGTPAQARTGPSCHQRGTDCPRVPERQAAPVGCNHAGGPSD
jgi:hypothetical protein